MSAPPSPRPLLFFDPHRRAGAVFARLGEIGLAPRKCMDAGELRAWLARAAGPLPVIVVAPAARARAWCRWFRRHRRQARLLVLPDRCDAEFRARLLEAGADDCMALDGHVREVLACARVLLRQLARDAGADAGSGLAFAGWRVDPTGLRLCRGDGRSVPLSASQMRLLLVLLRHPAEPVPRERLRTAFAEPGQGLDDRRIDLQISRLRRKLGQGPHAPCVIRTVRGRGYLLELPRRSA